MWTAATELSELSDVRTSNVPHFQLGPLAEGMTQHNFNFEEHEGQTIDILLRKAYCFALLRWKSLNIIIDNVFNLFI